MFANGWGSPTQGWIFRDEANGVDRVVIQGNGYVGLGTDSPEALLHLNGGGILVSGDASVQGRYYCVSRLIADSSGCYYGD